MSAVLDTPLNGLGMVPLLSTIEGMKMSKSYREALNTVVSACRGESDLEDVVRGALKLSEPLVTSCSTIKTHSERFNKFNKSQKENK